MKYTSSSKEKSNSMWMSTCKTPMLSTQQISPSLPMLRDHISEIAISSAITIAVKGEMGQQLPTLKSICWS